jgi:hypothetical protein
MGDFLGALALVSALVQWWKGRSRVDQLEHSILSQRVELGQSIARQ